MIQVFRQNLIEIAKFAKFKRNTYVEFFKSTLSNFELKNFISTKKTRIHVRVSSLAQLRSCSSFFVNFRPILLLPRRQKKEKAADFSRHCYRSFCRLHISISLEQHRTRVANNRCRCVRLPQGIHVKITSLLKHDYV